MRIKRKEPWGYLIYNTDSHEFEMELYSKDKDVVPYTAKPIVLCAYISFACNMICRHCVVRDFGIPDSAGSLELYDKELISNINKSPFLVIDITGGEPLLPKLENNLIHLVSKLNRKGIVLDTNGTCYPSDRVLRLLRKKNVLVRVSWDSLNPNQEVRLRVFPSKLFTSRKQYMESKIETIRKLSEAGITVAVQTVLSGVNKTDKKLEDFPKILASLEINQWYFQRYIPSHKAKSEAKFFIDFRSYENLTRKLKNVSENFNIKCFAKRDKRHNSVFLLTQDGTLYTQDDKTPGKKILLGNFNEVTKKNTYFQLVSVSDHSDRYYTKEN